jgi:protein tyrosine/serine phosphatase
MSAKYRARSIYLAVFSLVLAISAASVGKTHNGEFPNIKIKNFGQMDDRFYRGGQPDEDDYQALAGLGIKTVIDLRDDPKDYEKPAVEAAGMRYVNLPMNDKKYPSADQINKFLNLVNDSQTGKFFVHCAGGRHRTGVVGAVYRFTHDGWDYDRVYAEMKDYDFYSRWGHGPMKKFVQDYWQQIQSQTMTTSAAAGVSH